LERNFIKKWPPPTSKGQKKCKDGGAKSTERAIPVGWVLESGEKRANFMGANSTGKRKKTRENVGHGGGVDDIGRLSAEKKSNEKKWGGKRGEEQTDGTGKSSKS